MGIRQDGTESAETPSGYFVLMPQQAEGEKIELGRILQALWEAKFWIAGAAFAGAVVAGIWAFYIAVPIYRSQATVTVRMNGPNNNGGIGGAMSSLAALGGVNLGSQNPERVEFISVLRSRRLTEEFIRQYDLLPVLFHKLYDPAAKQWKDPQSQPTIQDGIDFFMTSILLISEARETGLVTVRMDWQDRVLVAEWVDNFIKLANQDLRLSALKETSDNLAYLTKEAQQVQVESLKQSIVRLMENNLNRAMLANAQADYAFRVIDPPRVSDPNKKVAPSRKLAIMIGFAIGGFIAALLTLWLARKKIHPPKPA